MKRNMRGFTLAELLIVVAIIAVLVAIAFPVFTKQLEKSRESVDFSNMRSAYAEVMAAAISGDTGSPLKKADGTFQAQITLKQKQEDWQTDGVEGMRIGDVPYEDWDSKMPAIDGTATVTFYPSSDKVIIDWRGSGSGPGGGPGNIPALSGLGHDIENGDFCQRGVVLQDQSGTYVLELSGTYQMWVRYHNDGISAKQLAEEYPQSVKRIDTSDIKDSHDPALKVGDVCYHAATNKYYYIPIKESSGDIPAGSWVPLIH